MTCADILSALKISLCIAFLAIAHQSMGAEDCEFNLHGSSVFSPKVGAWDGGEVNPGAVIYHDGRFHMFYNGLKQWPQGYSIGYASSQDGIDWQRVQAEPILTIKDIEPGAHKNLVANSVLVDESGTWILYFSVAHSKDSFTGHIGRATAPAPQGPWQIDSEPVLRSGAEEEWDGNGVGHASVVITEEGYVMYYTGFGEIELDGYRGVRGLVGLAKSVDGIHWEKYDNPETTDALYSNSDPVFRADPEKGVWDRWHILDPNVRYTGNSWTMIYRASTEHSYGDIGCATSEDGIVWHRFKNNPIMTKKMVKKAGVFLTTYSHSPDAELILFEAGWVDDSHIYLLSRP